ncbi:MAG TPA: hypothetical protein DCF33_09200, partial [Saprospirales bacterium]|nr:hypothetical protein [Saprospirales bacterium]
MTPTFAYQSPDFSLENTSSVDLRMVAGDLCVSLLLSKGNRALYVKSWQISGTEQSNLPLVAELRTILGGELALQRSYTNKICALAVPASTLVPKRLFSSSSLEKYFKLLLSPEGQYQYDYMHLPALDAYLVWATEKQMHQLLNPYFDANQFTHLAVSLISQFSLQAQVNGFSVMANIRGQNVQILVFDRQHLVFYNAFEFSKPNDLLYYILLIYKQFDLNPSNLPLQLSGTLLEDSEIFRLILR